MSTRRARVAGRREEPLRQELIQQKEVSVKIEKDECSEVPIETTLDGGTSRCC